MKTIVKILAIAIVVIFNNVAFTYNLQVSDITIPSQIEPKVTANSQPDDFGFYEAQFINTPVKVRFDNGFVSSEIVMIYNYDYEYNESEGRRKVNELTETISKSFPKDRNISVIHDVCQWSFTENCIVFPHEAIFVSIYHNVFPETKKGDIAIRIIY